MGISRRSALAVLCFTCVVAAAITSSSQVAGQEDFEVYFEFRPMSSTYAPGENFSINFTIRSVLVAISGEHNDIAVAGISAWFSWMPPNTWEIRNLSGAEDWIAPGDMRTYSLNLSVPEGIQDGTYGYKLKVDYKWWGPYGVLSRLPWQSETYRDFTVAAQTTNGGGTTDDDGYWVLAVAGLALVLAVGAIGAVMYHTTRKRRPAGAYMSDAATLGLAEAPAAAAVYPVIRATPGERFPIEKGVIYLVKEKRPGIGFAMFKEAVANGALGMIVAREHPERLRQIHEFQATKVLWLTRRVGVDHIDPTELSLLSLEISKFVEKANRSVVLIEGLEYVITQNNFESVLRFVNHLHDFVLAHNCAVVVIIDPRVLSTRELALLERSARIVEAAEPVEPRPDALADELEG